jgi:hypothetical protein
MALIAFPFATFKASFSFKEFVALRALKREGVGQMRSSACSDGRLGNRKNMIARFA